MRYSYVHGHRLPRLRSMTPGSHARAAADGLPESANWRKLKNDFGGGDLCFRRGSVACEAFA
jgi:hypothetical protein